MSGLSPVIKMIFTIVVQFQLYAMGPRIGTAVWQNRKLKWNFSNTDTDKHHMASSVTSVSFTQKCSGLLTSKQV